MGIVPAWIIWTTIGHGTLNFLWWDCRRNLAWVFDFPKSQTFAFHLQAQWGTQVNNLTGVIKLPIWEGSFRKQIWKIYGDFEGRNLSKIVHEVWVGTMIFPLSKPRMVGSATAPTIHLASPSPEFLVRCKSTIYHLWQARFVREFSMWSEVPFFFGHGWKSKNRGIYPKMDGENNGKPILRWMIWGYHYFRKHPHGGFGKKQSLLEGKESK